MSPPARQICNMAGTNRPLVIWQWNCRSLRRKKALLQQFIYREAQKPDIILIQEACGLISLPGYEHFTQGSITKRDKRAPQGVTVPITTVTYVAKHIPAIQIDTDSINNSIQEHVTVQCRFGSRDVLIINAYWVPRLDCPSLKWLDTYTKLHKDKDIIIAGDFNTHNISWGYQRTTRAGQRLERKMQDNKYTFLNDTTEPTRQGNSVERDSNPDLSWYRGIGNVTWANLHESLGSDHYIIEVTLSIPRSKARLANADSRTQLTDWHRFRSDLDRADEQPDLHSWVKYISETRKKYTKMIARTAENPHIDSHLLNLWDKRHRIVQNWKKHKQNHSLRKLIEQITVEAQEYAQKLCTENWLETCDKLNGRLHTARVWNILRSLLGQGKPRHTMDKIMMSSGQTREEITDEIRQTFYPLDQNAEQLPDYPTESLEESTTGINSLFTLAELHTALSSLKRNTTPGKDGITYSTLRNLPSSQLEQLLEYINNIWESGILPEEWKTAIIIPIPKPGKPANCITNLRPISLTSCVSKLMERMALNRLNWHLENSSAFPYTMTGFRSHISTQDTMLRISEDVYQNHSLVQTRVIAGVDIHKAFDHVKHSAILKNLLTLRTGARLYYYIKDFLTGRSIQIQINGELSAPYPLSVGVPQGSILSPTLFNIALLDLPARLSSIALLEHNIYADDITIWCCKGSLGEQEHTIQSGLDTIHEYVNGIGLKCSPTKSEYIVVTNQIGRRAEEQRQSISLHIEHNEIPRRSNIKILGFILQDDGRAEVWLEKTIRQLNQIYHMLSRVTRKHRGLKEQELRRIIEALVYSRVLYQLPYQSLTKTQHSKLETALRKYTRLALGVPRFAANDLVAATGLFNTLDERITICRQAQIERLQTSPQGRKLLEHQGYQTGALPPFPPLYSPPWDSLPRFTVLPIPQHMQPHKHEARRSQLVKRINRENPLPDTTYYYTDASHSEGRCLTAVVGPDYEHVNAHIGVPDPSDAEALAILEAVTRPHHPTQRILIRTDSQDACRMFRDNLLPEHIHSLLQCHLDAHPLLCVTLQWIPGHQGIGGNSRAHELTRVVSFPGPPCLWPSEFNPREHRKTLHKERTSLLKQLRANADTFITPPANLSREDSAILRRLQTNSIVTPLFRHYIQGLPGPPKCPNCMEYPSLEHCLWHCPHTQPKLQSALSIIPTNIKPRSWTDWLTPPPHATHILLPVLIQHVRDVLGEDW